MPRRSGKKKKGKVVRPEAVHQVKAAFTDKLNEKLAAAGLAKVAGVSNLELPQNAAQTTAGTDSQLDESVYSYYSQSVNQSAINDDANEDNGLTPGEVPDVHNIKADIDGSEQEETKGSGDQLYRQIKTSRGEEKSKGDTLAIDKSKNKVPQSARQNESPEISQPSESAKSTSKQDDIQVLHEEKVKDSQVNTDQNEETNKVVNKSDAQDAEESDGSKKNASFDDFYAGFGSDNDVPILVIKKEVKPAATEVPKEAPVAPQVKVEPEIAVEQKEDEQKDVAFFDDFDAAFGSDNDVPILVIKKEVKPAPKVEEKPQKQEEQKVEKELAKPKAEPVVVVKKESPPASAPKKTENVVAASAVSASTAADESSKKASQMLGPRLGDDTPLPKTTQTKPTPVTKVEPTPAPKLAPVIVKTPAPQPVVQNHQPEQSFQIKPIKTEPQVQAAPKPVAEVKKSEANPVKTVQIDTTDKQERVVKNESLQTAPKEIKGEKKTKEEDDQDSEDGESQQGGGGRMLMYGVMCMAAAGAIFYVKKNNIPVEEIVRKNIERLQDHFQNLRRQ